MDIVSIKENKVPLQKRERERNMSHQKESEKYRCIYKWGATVMAVVVGATHQVSNVVSNSLPFSLLTFFLLYIYIFTRRLLNRYSPMCVCVTRVTCVTVICQNIQ
jgi:hypothetical protein